MELTEDVLLGDDLYVVLGFVAFDSKVKTVAPVTESPLNRTISKLRLLEAKVSTFPSERSSTSHCWLSSPCMRYPMTIPSSAVMGHG